MHKCLSAERSTCLNETEGWFSLPHESPMCSFTLPDILLCYRFSEKLSEKRFLVFKAESMNLYIY